MRTTLDIEDDVLQAAKELAQQEGRTVGHIVSKLARQGLGGTTENKAPKMRNGVPILPPRGEVVTMERIEQIRNREGV